MTDELINSLMLQAAGYSMFFAGWPERDMLAALHDVREAKNAELAETLDTDTAKLIAAAFVWTIARGKAEIEAANHGKQLQ
jgi:hypothetical protein